jgi:hypothetical protein
VSSVSFKEPVDLEIGTAATKVSDGRKANESKLPDRARKEKGESERKKREERRMRSQSIAAKGEEASPPLPIPGDRTSTETTSETQSTERKKGARAGELKISTRKGEGQDSAGPPHRDEPREEDARITGLKSATRELKALIRAITKELKEGEGYEDMMLSTLGKMKIHKVTDLWEQFAGAEKDTGRVRFFRNWFEDQSKGHLLSPTALKLLQHTGPKQQAYEQRWLREEKKREKDHQEQRVVAAARAKEKREKKREAAAAGHKGPLRRKSEKHEGGSSTDVVAAEIL